VWPVVGSVIAGAHWFRTQLHRPAARSAGSALGASDGRDHRHDCCPRGHHPDVDRAPQRSYLDVRARFPRSAEITEARLPPSWPPMACTYHRALLLEDDVPSCEGTFNAMERQDRSPYRGLAHGPTVRASTYLHMRDELGSSRLHRRPSPRRTSAVQPMSGNADRSPYLPPGRDAPMSWARARPLWR
jgi:hypothetical protein